MERTDSDEYLQTRTAYFVASRAGLAAVDVMRC